MQVRGTRLDYHKVRGDVYPSRGPVGESQRRGKKPEWKAG